MSSPAVKKMPRPPVQPKEEPELPEELPEVKDPLLSSGCPMDFRFFHGF